MNPNSVLRFIGILIIFLGASMCLPFGAALLTGDGSSNALAGSLIITVGIGTIIFLSTKKNKEVHLSHRDGVAIVTFGWIAAGLVGAIPFLISGAIPNFTDAYFESVSGFTTTGATILSDIEEVSAGILLWRSLTQWLGGMGIIVLSIAILPFLGVGGMQLYRAEIPSPVVDKLKPRISDTAKTLWKVYLIITALEIIFLSIGGMPFFDAVNHAFCTMPTGGFSPKNASIAYYDSAYIDAVIVVFMIMAGINFSLHFKVISEGPRVFWKDPECKVFLSFVIFITGVVTFNIYGTVYNSLLSAFRFASFQVTSIITTTGFVKADFVLWPTLSCSLLLICMFLGGMAGSTGGGLKTMRVMLLIEHGYQEIFRIVHPHAVTTIKLGGRAVPQETLNSIWGFFTLYLLLFVSGSIFMAMLGLDMVSSFSSVAACIFNVGPGLGIVGPVGNYLGIPVTGKWILIFCMLLGRLEIYTVLVLLTPEFWRK
ncbi:MAG: TrkH family potassium uptake protein [Deltaproteobacteria bacterium]|nr:TrkH family potassium uptake protein [Deltaproteobacteria bacterium]